MSITIKEVQNTKDLWAWVRFPNKLYQDNPYFVPFLETDEFETFSKDKNPAYEFCETKLFLAYKDERVVGRIGGLINRAYNEKWDKNAIRFTRFDFIDDFEVSGALFDAVVAWGKERGHEEIMGPIGFSDLDHQGMLVEGFDKLNMSITFYNHPYYLAHMERLGLEKDIDWIEYMVYIPDEGIPLFDKLAERVLKTEEYEIVTYSDRKVLFGDAMDALKLVDTAYSKLYGTVPLTEAVIRHAIKGYFPLVNLNYICSVKDKEGKIVGFGILVPSIAKALKASNGKLFPFGIFRLLKALRGKNELLEMFLIAVDPALQKQGVPVLILSALMKSLNKNGIKRCETGPMLETNTAVHSLWRRFEKEQHKRRRCYKKAI